MEKVEKLKVSHSIWSILFCKSLVLRLNSSFPSKSFPGSGADYRRDIIIPAAWAPVIYAILWSLRRVKSNKNHMVAFFAISFLKCNKSLLRFCNVSQTNKYTDTHFPCVFWASATFPKSEPCRRSLSDIPSLMQFSSRQKHACWFSSAQTHAAERQHYFLLSGADVGGKFRPKSRAAEQKIDAGAALLGRTSGIRAEDVWAWECYYYHITQESLKSTFYTQVCWGSVISEGSWEDASVESPERNATCRVRKCPSEAALLSKRFIWFGF